ncbi:CHAT domain-containing protein [Streptomyces phyllanthi]|uniref:CHAT domain-containing protein n=1 Tax=Streptomyces phyllanthi TaxID=1803180 RepID=A0A5N8VWW3_9ACTN|nr:CHAT domain-containing protein [Streptomyces phyllanthi]MPY39747.1 CHAT domain-containing protein [Streptomyces phyllanthi]
MLDRLVADAAVRERTDPGHSRVRLELERVRRTLRDCRAHGVAEVRDQVASGLDQANPAMQETLKAAGLREPAQLGTDPAMIAWREATILCALGRTEEAVVHLERAARVLRERCAYGMEGEVEFLLWELVRGDRATGDLDAALRHAELAEAAFRKADSKDGLRRVLTVLAVDTALPTGRSDGRSDFYLDRLAEVDAGHGAWFRSYARASRLLLSAADEAAEALRWCMDSVHLLSDDAGTQTHWRNECARKLAEIDPSTPVGEASSTSASDQFLAALRTWNAQAGDDVVADRLHQAVRLAEEDRRHIRSAATQRGLSASLGMIYLVAAAAAQRAGRPVEALDILERNTSRSLLGLLTTNRLWADAEPPPTSMSTVYKHQTVRYLSPSASSAGTGGAQQQLETSLHRLRRALSDDDEHVLTTALPPYPRFEPASSAALAARLTQDEIVLVYAPIGGIYSITCDGADRVASFDVQAVERLCAEYYRFATSPESHDDHSRLAAVSAAIVAACVDPVRTAVADRRRVVVVPSGALWTVPLAALEPSPLSAGHAVSYVPSLSTLLAVLEQPRHRRRVERFVGAGDPDGSLPYAAAELVRAAAGFYDRSVHSGSGIDVAALLADLPEADVVHFACHGITFDNHPDLSALHLSGTGGDRRLLWAPDLVRLRLRARLVVLAACHSGLSRALPGNEYAGLPGVLLAAGAKAVVGPLWQVDDQVTATLMEHFYIGLAQAGPAAALHHAQEAVRSRPETAHPYYWAAFQPFGLP